jgi:hypothetical protein
VLDGNLCHLHVQNHLIGVFAGDAIIDHVLADPLLAIGRENGWFFLLFYLFAILKLLQNQASKFCMRPTRWKRSCRSLLSARRILK